MVKYVSRDSKDSQVLKTELSDQLEKEQVPSLDLQWVFSD